MVFRKSERGGPWTRSGCARRWPTTSPRCTGPTSPRPTRSRPRSAGRCRCSPAVRCTWRPSGRATCTCWRPGRGSARCGARRWRSRGRCRGSTWTLRFYDPVVTPALGLISEDAGPAYAEVRGALGVTTVVYHVVAQPGSGLTAAPRRARRRRARGRAHGGGARTSRRSARGVPGREALVDELVGAAHAGLPRAQALLARAIAPRDEAVAALAEAAGEPGPGRGPQGAAGVGGRPLGLDPTPMTASPASADGESRVSAHAESPFRHTAPGESPCSAR